MDFVLKIQKELNDNKEMDNCCYKLDDDNGLVMFYDNTFDNTLTTYKYKNIIYDINTEQPIASQYNQPITNTDNITTYINNNNITNDITIRFCYEGTHIIVFNHNNKWFISTRKCLDARESKWNNKSHYDMFMETIKGKFNLNDLDKNYCYHFNLIHNQNYRSIKYSTDTNFMFLDLLFITEKQTLKQIEINDSTFPALDFVVEKCVNSVGVNVNTASASLLSYVSGVTKAAIKKIIDYRESVGKIMSRDEIKKKKILTPKAYEQAIGFLRINDGDNVLDSTAIHPESYDVALNVLKDLGFTIKDIGSSELVESLDKIDVEKDFSKYNTDKYTLEDVISSLKKPNLDPRDSYPQPILKSNVLDIKDLHVGDKLQGTVRNVVDFGLFIDIGLHDDGLAHISKLSNSYIKHPSDLFSVGDIVDCYVDDISLEKNKVSLSLLER